VLVGVLSGEVEVALIGPRLGQEFGKIPEVLALVEFGLDEVVSGLDV